jgi:hypothetical protein
VVVVVLLVVVVVLFSRLTSLASRNVSSSTW